MSGSSFRGTSLEQDGRFGKAEEKLIAKLSKAGKFSAVLDKKVNLKKVNLDVISKWITAKIIQLVGFEDDILINLVINMLEGGDVDPKKMQLDVTGFLEKQSQSFVEELWTLLVDAQNQPSGIPSVFIEKKKEEILNREAAHRHIIAHLPPSVTQSTERAPVQVDEQSSDRITAATDERSRSRRDDSRDRGRNDDGQHRDTRDRDRGTRRRSRSPEDRRDDRHRSSHRRSRERSPGGRRSNNDRDERRRDDGDESRSHRHHSRRYDETRRSPDREKRHRRSSKDGDDESREHRHRHHHRSNKRYNEVDEVELKKEDGLSVIMDTDGVSSKKRERDERDSENPSTVEKIPRAFSRSRSASHSSSSSSEDSFVPL